MANWRTAFKSDFLASWDIDGVVKLTIEKVEIKEVQLQKREKKVVAYFKEKHFANGEPIKPMILNATNCKVLNSYTGTKETNDWINLLVEIGTKENKGRIGEALGLSINRVLSGSRVVDKVGIIKDLLRTAIDLTDRETEYVNEIINTKQVENYDKAINHLKSKQSKQDEKQSE